MNRHVFLLVAVLIMIGCAEGDVQEPVYPDVPIISEPPPTLIEEQDIIPPTLIEGTITNGEMEVVPDPLNDEGLHFDYNEPVRGTIQIVDLPHDIIQGLAAQVIGGAPPQFIQEFPVDLAILLQPGGIASLPPKQLQRMFIQVLAIHPVIRASSMELIQKSANAGKSLNWISNVKDQTATLILADGRELQDNTIYIVEIDVTDNAGNRTVSSIIFTTKIEQ